MREILFRGKTEKGEWVYGNYCGAEYLTINGMQHIIIEVPRNGRSAKVDPETVGQYTGVTDINGTKIFEGDILKDVSDVGNEQLYEVYYNEDLCAFMLDDQYWITPTRDWLSKDDKNPTTMMLEIIGNIHDNPELLNGSEAVK